MTWDGDEMRHNERIAVLEQRVCTLKDELDDIQVKLDNILAEMTRYKGFIGGVTFIVSGAYVAWQLIGDHMRKWL